MRKKSLLPIIILIICIALTACILPTLLNGGDSRIDDWVDTLGGLINGEEPEEFTYRDPEPYAPVTTAPAPVPASVRENEEEVITIVDEAQDDVPEDDAASTVEDDTELIKKLAAERYYAYGTLSQEERRIYRAIYTTLFNFGGKTPMGTLDSDMIGKAYDCVMADNPELFYVKGYNMVRYMRGSKLESISISGIYNMEKDDVAGHQARVDAYIDTCLAGAPQGIDEYEKIKYLYEYIIKNTEYDLNAENSQNCLSVFENGRSVCQGYAEAMQYLMIRMGMMCTVVRGVTNKGETHAWNLVRSNGDYYYVDATWGDMSYEIRTGEDLAQLPQMPEVSYEYLCVTTDEISRTHTPDDTFVLPQCVARYDNYYVRSGNYFTEVNDAQLRSVFDNAYANGDSFVSIKCSDPMVYSDMMDYLTGEGHLYDYLYRDGTVNYMYLDKLNEVIFYI